MKTRLLTFLLIATAALAQAEWTPPDNPKPSEILNEAQRDAAEERYEDALAKYVWFHKNALKYERSTYGVRLSFALSAWLNLAEVYPPALEKLKAVRDEAAETARKDEDNAPAAFHDFQSINERLGEETKTRDLFVWLDHNKPMLAMRVSHVVLPDLVKTKEYKLAGKYLDPAGDLDRLLQEYKGLLAQAEKPEAGEKMKKFAEKRFSNGVTTLVALLVVNDRKEEAAHVAELASREVTSPELLEALKKAWEGTVPDPWP